MVVLVHFDMDHVLKSRVSYLRERHDAVCGNGCVPHIFHAPEVRVLHPYFTVYGSCISVSWSDGFIKPGKFSPYLSELFSFAFFFFFSFFFSFLSGTVLCLHFQLLTPADKVPDQLPYRQFFFSELLRPGKDIYPHYAVVQDIKSLFGSPGIRIRRHEQLEHKSAPVRILKLPFKGRISSDPEEKEIGSHRSDAVVIDNPVPSRLYGIPFYRNVSVCYEVCVARICNNGRPVSAFCSHIINAGHDPLEPPLLALRDLLWRSPCRSFVVVQPFKDIFCRPADRVSNDCNFGVRRNYVPEVDFKNTIISPVPVRDLGLKTAYSPDLKVLAV
ncbi:hypothetical protein SDC9_92506 [bioreactor metagenome]|uniref:Uncharacterized protein n=1 Tax=bioreactor metagenome TaxID=1076179 RepID=A0A645A7U2_9ZZZZ